MGLGLDFGLEGTKDILQEVEWILQQFPMYNKY
jgi:hypothetical protein